jgi:hypothetical protein
MAIRSKPGVYNFIETTNIFYQKVNTLKSCAWLEVLTQGVS